jgi:hypothetical protein
MTETNTLDNPDLSLAEHRAIRDGAPLPEKIQTSEAAAETPAAESAPEPESGEATEETKSEETTETNKPKPKRGLVDEVVKLRQAKRDLEARLAAVSAPKPETAEAQTPAPLAASNDAEPQSDSYSDYGTYTRDLIKWQIRAAQREDAAEAAKAAQQTAAQAKAAAWNDRVVAASAAKPDFQAVAMNVDLPVSPVMGEAITDSDIGADILYYLGQNPAEAARIAKLSDVAQIREIGKLEARLTPDDSGTDESDEEPLKPLPISKAPAPVSRPQGGTISKPNPVRNLEGMTQREYRAYREAGKIR